MGNETIIAVGRDNFEREVLESELPVLVDFWAAWCGPCRTVEPVLDEIAVERAERLKIVKLDVDEDQELAIRFQVSSIPTFILFAAGEVVDRLLGAMPKMAIERFLDRQR